ncbi:hypothetical protein F4818DRAFT_439102 [Hypoxylon cercidicola]|nr:hypothetical protein F4818DRAFT_439102 [Hypoxylon cercidicola]
MTHFAALRALLVAHRCVPGRDAAVMISRCRTSGPAAGRNEPCTTPIGTYYDEVHETPRDPCARFIAHAFAGALRFLRVLVRQINRAVSWCCRGSKLSVTKIGKFGRRREGDERTPRSVLGRNTFCGVAMSVASMSAVP